MMLEQALDIARDLKYGPLPRPEDPHPDIPEAVELIAQARHTCGFNWITGEMAEQVLRQRLPSPKASPVREIEEGGSHDSAPPDNPKTQKRSVKCARR